MGLIATGVIRPFAILHWAGKDVTAELSRYVKSMTYTDVMESKQTGTDTLSLTLFNKDRRFCQAWYPTKGDTLKPGIGWLDEQGQRHEWLWGEFSIDEVSFKIGPDDVMVGANAKPPTIKRGFIDNQQCLVQESVTLERVAESWAKESGLSFIKAPDTPGFQFARIEQRDETTPAFLTRLSEQTSVPMAIKGKRLVMGNFKDDVIQIDTLNRDILTALNLPDSARSKYVAVEVNGYDQQAEQLFSYRAGDATATGDRVKMLHNIDNVKSMADARAYAESYLQNGADGKQGAKGRMSVTNIMLTTAHLIEFLHFGNVPNRWKPTTVTTSISGRSWTASAQLARAT
ncbi:phage late control D family protein [Vibrio sp. Vb339]|uniref:phage late control D family protein n=1 Tax=Vibrio sp. Vb339 TaxID=1192013 RepID=UPI001557AC23|nr:hypothetical protein [Vibrio sp. Vb339]